jgi:hypothetical protein
MQRSFEIRDCLCPHGAIISKGFTDPLFIEIYELNGRMLSHLESLEDRIDEQISVFFNYLIGLCKKRPGIAANPESAKLFFSFSVDLFEDYHQEVWMAKRSLEAGIFLEKFQKSGEVFLNCFLDESVSAANPDLIQGYFRLTDLIQSKEGYLKAINERITCDCLSKERVASLINR